MSKEFKAFTIEDYLENIEKSKFKVWAKKEKPFENRIPIKMKIKKENAIFGLDKQISAIILILKKKKELLYDFVNFGYSVSIERILTEFNEFLERRISELIEDDEIDLIPQEAHLIPLELTENRINYRFFISEINFEDEKNLGFIIEIMRAAEHMKNIITLMMLIPEDKYLDEASGVDWDSVRSYAINFSVSQLREALKLFDNFINTDFFKKIKDKLPEDGKEAFNYLYEFTKDFKNKQGLFERVLLPLRNATFHYDEKKATSWGLEKIEYEKERKPRFSYIRLTNSKLNFIYGPGSEFDEKLLMEYTIMGFDEPFKSQLTVIECQNKYLTFVRCFIELLMEINKINQNRNHDFFMKYFHGYKKRQ